MTFTHAAGLIANGGSLKNFSIAGADRTFFSADAKIADGAVVVSSPQVPQPVAVRYAWDDNPEGCVLFNQSGLPAAPFRTDESNQVATLMKRQVSHGNRAAPELKLNDEKATRWAETGY